MRNITFDPRAHARHQIATIRRNVATQEPAAPSLVWEAIISGVALFAFLVVLL